MGGSKYKIFRTRKLQPIPCIWNGISQTSLNTKKIHGAAIQRQWNYYTHDGYYTGIDIEKEWDAAANFIMNRISNDSKYVPYIYRQQYRCGKNLVSLSRKIIKQDLQEQSLARLLKYYETIQDAWLKFDGFNISPWLMGGDLLLSELKKLAREIGLSEEEFATLATPSVPSFSAKEELDIIKLVIQIKTGGNANVFREVDEGRITYLLPKPLAIKLNDLVNKFYWIPFGYDGPETYDLKHYCTEIRSRLQKKNAFLKKRKYELENYAKIIKNRQAKIIRKFHFPASFIRPVNFLYVLSKMTDQRKEFTFPAHIAFSKVIKTICTRLDLSVDALKYVSWGELVKYNKDATKLRKIYEKRRKIDFFVYFYHGEYRIVEAKGEVKKLYNRLLPKIPDTHILTGVTASRRKQKGIVVGTVKILLHPEEMNKLNEGEILITTMTTPEYVPAMRRSAAIITDEGGITSHAAIVSRELGIPCVIGTKFATKVFNDGDIVEVNTDKSTIKLIR